MNRTYSACVFVAAALIVPAACICQTTTSPLQGFTPGVALPAGANGSIPLSNFEVFNPANSQLGINIPLIKIQGRGSVSVPLLAPFSSPVWEASAIQYQYNCNQYGCSTGYGYIIQTAEWNPFQPAIAVGGSMVSRGSGDYCTGSNWHQTLTRLTFSAPDGSQIEFIDTATNGAVESQGFNRGVSFVSDNGSAAKFTATAAIVDPPTCGSTTGTPSGTMIARDGTQYIFTNGTVTKIEDNNGNITTINPTGPYQITDNLGRQYNLGYGSQPGSAFYSVTYPGQGGATRTIKLLDGPLASYLIAGATQTYGQMFPQIPGPTTASGPSNASGSFNPNNVIYEIDLPDGVSKYLIRYDSYGDVAQITLPTGGVIKYTYNTVYSPVSSPPATTYLMTQQLATRSEYANGTTLTSQMKFPGAGEIDHYDGAGHLLSRETHTIADSGTLPTSATNYNSWQYDQSNADNYYDADGTTVLKSVATSYFHDPNCSVNCGTAQTITTTMGNAVKQTSFAYDNNSNVVAQIDYDWGSGSPGTAMRQTTIAYNSNPAYLNANMVSLPSEIKVLDGPGANLFSDVQLGYDHNGTYPNNVQNGTGPDPSANAINSNYHDSFFNGDVARGNLTVVIPCQNASTTSPATCQSWLPNTVNTYDVAGNLVKTTDANGNSTAFGYTDNFPAGLTGLNTFAFQTSVTNAMGQSVWMQYDYYTGHPVYVSDMNGVQTGMSYSDTMDRLTSVTNAIFTSKNTQTLYTYPSLTNTSILADQTSYNDQALMWRSLSDGLGRPLTSAIVETRDGSGNPVQQVATDTTYDALGRISSTNTPWRNTGVTEPALGTNVTTYSYDGLGRLLAVNQPDGSIRKTAYSGNQITTTDEAGRSKNITTDALGRIARLSEDPLGLNVVTTYGWSPTGDLTSVTQGAQTRTFSYDAVGRRLSTTQPESGTSSFTYDNVGNLKTATDARSTSKTYTYDSLDRITQITYSDGTFPATYTYDNGCCATNAGNTHGQLLSISNANSTTSYTYDAFGHPATSSQTTGGVTYNFAYTYNLAGSLTSETYPDGRALTTTYDSANRPTSLVGKLGTNTTNYITQTQYWPNGIPWFYTRGSNNNVTHANAINSRMQVPESYEAIGNTNTPANMLFVSCPNWGVNVSNYGTYNICPTNPVTGNTPAGITYNNIHDNGTVQSYREIWGGPSSLTFDQVLSYDNLNRLTSAQDTGGWTRSFNYDTWGNLWVPVASGPLLSPYTPTQNVYNAKNQNAGLPNVFPAGNYDQAGNLRSLNNATSTANYNAENQLTSLNTNGGAAEMIAYDARGSRVKKTYSANSTVYVYDAFGLASLYLNGTWSKDYVFDGPGHLIATENVPGAACTTCYYGFDHLGSVRIVMDQNGNVVGRHDYLPFGEEITGSGTGGPTAGTQAAGRDHYFGILSDVTEKFTGEIRDSEAGLDFFNARYFSAPLGRFASPDPNNAGADLFSSQSWNGYVYALNDPCSVTDPFGLAPCTFMISIVNSDKLTKNQLDQATAEVNRILGGGNSGLSAKFTDSNPSWTGTLRTNDLLTLLFGPSAGSGRYGESDNIGNKILPSANIWVDNIGEGKFPNPLGVSVGRTILHEFTHWAFPFHHLRGNPLETNIASDGATYLKDDSLASLSQMQIARLKQVCQNQSQQQSGGGSPGGINGYQGIFYPTYVNEQEGFFIQIGWPIWVSIPGPQKPVFYPR